MAHPPALLAGMRWRRVLPGEERQLAELRRWVACLLPTCAARDDVTAVASELAANAIKHTLSGRGGWFAVELTWHQNAVRVAVADSGSPGEPHVIDDPASENGRGLLLVRGLSSRMGACGDRRGLLCWADIAWQDRGMQTAAAAPDGYETAIRDGQAALARRFTGVPTWFGRATLSWWALAGPSRLVTAPTAQELAGTLYRLLDVPRPPPGESPHVPRSVTRPQAASQNLRTSVPGRGPAISQDPGADTGAHPDRGTAACPVVAAKGRQRPVLIPVLAASPASSPSWS